MSHYDVHLQRARDFFEDGNYAGSRAAAEKACSCAPNDCDEEKLLLALCFQKMEYSEEAFRILSELAAGNPSPEAAAEFALACAERGQCDDLCRSFAQRSIDEDPDLAQAYLALFFCDVADDRRIDALHNLKRSINRGAQISEQKTFELVRGWCQEACNQGQMQSALDLSAVIVDTFSSLDFFLLHARLCELCEDYRQSVQYYKYALHQLSPGTAMRLEVLEAIARIAI